MEHPDPATTPFGEHFELTTHVIAREVIRRGYSDLHWLRPAFFLVDVDGQTYGWNQTRCNITSTMGAEITKRKDYTRAMMRRAGLSVADGGSYETGQLDRALRRAKKIGWPVVVKPASTGGGRGVSVANSADEFRTSWQEASIASRIVVERRVTGDEARFLVVQGRCIAVTGRIPAHVIGDGRSTVAELVKAKNEVRAGNPHLRRTQVPLGPGDPQQIPTAGERVVLDQRGGFHSGADSIDLTDTVHPSYRDIAERAMLAIPALGLAGIDIIATDWSQPADAGNYIIVEVNSRPGIGPHHFPAQGEPRDVARTIVDACGIPSRSAERVEA